MNPTSLWPEAPAAFLLESDYQGIRGLINLDLMLPVSSSEKDASWIVPSPDLQATIRAQSAFDFSKIYLLPLLERKLVIVAPFPISCPYNKGEEGPRMVMQTIVIRDEELVPHNPKPRGYHQKGAFQIRCLTNIS